MICKNQANQPERTDMETDLGRGRWIEALPPAYLHRLPDGPSTLLKFKLET